MGSLWPARLPRPEPAERRERGYPDDMVSEFLPQNWTKIYCSTGPLDVYWLPALVILCFQVGCGLSNPDRMLVAAEEAPERSSTAQDPSDEVATWHPWSRREGIAEAARFLEGGGLDGFLGYSCTRLPCLLALKGTKDLPRALELRLEFERRTGLRYFVRSTTDAEGATDTLFYPTGPGRGGDLSPEGWIQSAVRANARELGVIYLEVSSPQSLGEPLPGFPHSPD